MFYCFFFINIILYPPPPDTPFQCWNFIDYLKDGSPKCKSELFLCRPLTGKCNEFFLFFFFPCEFPVIFQMFLVPFVLIVGGKLRLVYWTIKKCKPSNYICRHDSLFVLSEWLWSTHTTLAAAVCIRTSAACVNLQSLCDISLTLFNGGVSIVILRTSVCEPY